MSGLQAEAKELLYGLGGAARKKLGQNFMISQSALDLIADAGSISAGETVLEIGPGLGFLTRSLLQKGASVVAIEKDSLYVGHLADFFKEKSFRVIESDILLFDPQALSSGRRIKVFGNIPYNITSPILEWLVENRRVVSQAVLTVQKEVAERITAEPGGKEWGPLSFLTHFYSRAFFVQKISKESFFPAPKVDSAVIRLEFSEKPLYPVLNEEHFFKLVRKAFQKRRKTILNALADIPEYPALTKIALAESLKKCQIEALRRPETLSIGEWGRLADDLEKIL